MIKQNFIKYNEIKIKYIIDKNYWFHFFFLLIKY